MPLRSAVLTTCRLLTLVIPAGVATGLLALTPSYPLTPISWSQTLLAFAIGLLSALGTIRRPGGVRTSRRHCAPAEALALTTAFAHELGQPLCALRALLGVLDHDRLDGGSQQTLRLIGEQLEQSAQLLTELRLLHGAAEPHLSAVDPMRLALRVQARMTGKEVTLRPPGESLPPVWADPALLEQALVRMMARIGTQPAGRVEMALHRQGDGVAITLDGAAGCGASADDFSQRLSRALIECQGGRLTRALAGRGCRLTITLPRVGHGAWFNPSAQRS